jgi:PAS domain S-box-containing protein
MGGLIMADARTPTSLQDLSPPESPSPQETLSIAAVLDALKMSLFGPSLDEVLTRIIRLIEAHSEGTLCSIFLLTEDGLHLQCGAAPSLPETYRTAIERLDIGPAAGSCGTAVYLRQPVFVCDTASDPKWAGLRDLALQNGLRAAWSSPIISHDGRVLGTFGMHYREVRHPAPGEIQLIDYASPIAGIAIESIRSQVAHQNASRCEISAGKDRLRTIIDTIPALVWSARLDGSAEFFNKRWLDYAGLSAEEAMDWGWSVALHADDRMRLLDHWTSALASGEAGEIEARLRRFDGQYRWFLFRASPLRDHEGEHRQVVRNEYRYR